jgi:hypothetical protein
MQGGPLLAIQPSSAEDRALEVIIHRNMDIAMGLSEPHKQYVRGFIAHMAEERSEAAMVRAEAVHNSNPAAATDSEEDSEALLCTDVETPHRRRPGQAPAPRRVEPCQSK